MKKIAIYITGWMMLLFSCSVDNDYIFDDISTHRLNQYIDECDELLVSAEQGWKFIYYPDTSQYGGYTFLMKFSKTDGRRVMMQCDINDEQSVSSYGFNAALGPIICFDTYSLLHLLADPNPLAFNGKAGLGYGGEYEFLILDVKSDCIKLLGKKNKREAQLVPATAEDWAELPMQREAIGRFNHFIPTGADQPFYHYLRIGTDTAFCFYSPTLRMAYLTYVEGGKTVPLKLPVYSTERGIHFDRPVNFGGQTFSELAFDLDSRAMSIVDEGVEGEFFWAASPTEPCRLRFPGAIEIAKDYDGFSLVERGYNLSNGKTNIWPEGHNIEGFRFYWRLAGNTAGEIYVRESGGMATYARLLVDSIAQDHISDRIFFEALQNSYLTGSVTNETNMWFGFTYSSTNGALNKYLTSAAGLTVIPVGGQFYMIRNDDNLSWALFTPLEENK